MNRSYNRPLRFSHHRDGFAPWIATHRLGDDFSVPGLTPAQELRLKACAAERHGTANGLIGIGMAVAPYYGAYKGFKYGSGLISTALWTLGGYFLGGLVGGFAGVAGLATVNSDCVREAGIFNGG